MWWFLGFLVGKQLGCEGGLGEALFLLHLSRALSPALAGGRTQPFCALVGRILAVNVPPCCSWDLLDCGDPWSSSAHLAEVWWHCCCPWIRMCLPPSQSPESESELLWDAVISTKTELFVLLESSRGNWLFCVCQLSSKLPLLRFDFPASDPALPLVPAASKAFHLGPGCALEQWQKLSLWLAGQLLLEQGCAVRFPLGLCLSFNLSPSNMA